MKNYLYAMGAILCWASLPVATGSGLESLSTEELMFYSFSSSAIFLYIMKAFREKSMKISFPKMKITLLGIWGIFIYHYVYYLALDHSSLTEGAILTTTWSFWIVIFSSLLEFRRLNIKIVLTALAGMGGIVLVITAGKGLSFGAEYLPGYLLALLCGLIWSSFSVALGTIKQEKDTITEFTIVAAFLSLLLFLFTLPHSIPSAKAIMSAIYLGTIPLGLSFYLWNKALKGGNLVVIGYLSYLTTPLAVLLVSLIHKGDVHPQVIVGMFVIIIASVIGKLSLKNTGNL
ncbi:MAG: DMT family transporter [Spirochaetales bacterium]|nr:DMT family transporter [Spirochaetales bacterium]